MTHFRSLLMAVITLVGMTSSFAQTASQPPTPSAEPLALRAIMKELGRNMQATVAAISQEDWTLVAQLGTKIAVHGEPPPGEKIKIITFLGPKAGEFRGHDQQSQQAAMGMKAAAEKSDGFGVIQAFARVQESCLACHQNHRSAIKRHFYGE